MYYQNYEDYMRSVLGYPVQNCPNIYENDNYFMPQVSNYSTYPMTVNADCSMFYPEVYKIIQPLITSLCIQTPTQITEGWLNQTANVVYENLQKNEKVAIMFNLKQQAEVRNSEVKSSNIKNDRGEETRQRPNLILDLIKILILNQILGENRPPIRPMHPSFPPRPPFPGGPGPVIPPRPRDLV